MTSDFDYANSTYFELYGFAHLEAFLTNKKRLTKLKRVFVYFNTCFAFPLVVSTFGYSIVMANMTVAQRAFDLAIFNGAINFSVKLIYFLWNLTEMRGLCLNFEHFKSSQHRPAFAISILNEKGGFMRRMARYNNIISYGNYLFWLVVPSMTLLVWNFLHVCGVVASQPRTLIPKFMPFKYAYDHRVMPYSMYTCLVEFLLLFCGIPAYMAVDLFFMCVVIMVCGQFEVLSHSLKWLSTIERAEELRGKEDKEAPLSLKDFIEDHQRLLKLSATINKILRPLLAHVFVCNMSVICGLLFAITDGDASAEASDMLADNVAYGSFIVTGLANLFMYCWQCNKLKYAEESILFATYESDWYKKDTKYRETILSIMAKSYRAKPITMLGVIANGVDLETFIDALRVMYSYYTFLQQVQ